MVDIIAPTDGELADKIKKAINYYEKMSGCGDATEIMNDAANLFASSYEEYIIIWDHLKEG